MKKDNWKEDGVSKFLLEEEEKEIQEKVGKIISTMKSLNMSFLESIELLCCMQISMVKSVGMSKPNFLAQISNLWERLDVVEDES